MIRDVFETLTEWANFYALPHLIRGTNVAGYMSWGAHSSLGYDYANNAWPNAVKWSGHSGWWIIETIESHNGVRGVPNYGSYDKWLSPNTFGVSDYSNTPVGAVCYVEEPGLPFISDSQLYFGWWAAGKNFAIAAWNSRKTPFLEAVGDPLTTR